ncbi:MAG: SDR family NAD(P)-dependent oxidoreductase [Pseudorhodoplanes sp.]|uniref:SDR family NAD(P)-dependent oxidoreductase n=1 Tax=Pseudorhodoplanes sp. TaxID=1934341 RepID=UPI003D1007B8
MSADLFRLDGKVALVTGAGSGLGREMALGLAAAGADVICADRDKGWVTETISIIHSTGGKASRIVFDVANEDEVALLGRAVSSSHGKLDVLINNAGVAPFPRRLHEVETADWKRVIDVNLLGTFLVTRAAIPLMLEAGAGSIVNVASLIGIVGFYPGFAVSGVAYAATKAGLAGMTRQIAAEYGRDNIRANAIAPGWQGAGTRLADHFKAEWSAEDSERFEQSIVAGTPMGRRGAPKELQGLVIYLASDASRYVTGQLIAHDGGWTAV